MNGVARLEPVVLDGHGPMLADNDTVFSQGRGWSRI